jgi:hypothetical protein
MDGAGSSHAGDLSLRTAMVNTVSTGFTNPHYDRHIVQGTGIGRMETL